MVCLWQPTFHQVRRSLDGFTSMTAPIRRAVRASASRRLDSADAVEKVPSGFWRETSEYA